MDYGYESVKLPERLAGKLTIRPKISIKTLEALSPLYTAGVAGKRIASEPPKVYQLTRKNNCVAVAQPAIRSAEARLFPAEAGLTARINLMIPLAGLCKRG